MSKPLAKINKAIKSVAAISLMLWLGGVTCVFGCEILSAEKSAQETQSHSVLASRSCHKRAKNREEVSLAKNLPTHPTMSCCPFAQQTAIQARNANTETQPTTVESNRNLLIELKERFQPNFSYRARPPDRGGTHLRNCVFLI